MKILYFQIKKKALVLLASFLLAQPAFSKAVELPEISVAVTATKIIRDHIKFPDFDIYKGQMEKVNVVFTVNETGNLVIANTTNTFLKKSIEEQFLKLTLKQLKADNAYSIQFNFKTQ